MRLCTITDAHGQPCDKKHLARGMCAGHYQRWKRGEALQSPLRPRGVTGCSVDGCGEEHHAKGRCATHYQQHLRSLKERIQ